jgi:glycosyltransferase involved in cell wall biosynthesis
VRVSVIVPTLNRFDALRVCIDSIREHTKEIDYEIIVIDGGSTDGTKEWLFFQQDLIVIQHNRRLGCVKAFNDGFRISRGEYCAQLSDDVELTSNCLAAACKMLDADDKLGQVVIHHKQGGKLQFPQFKTDHGKFLFAAFGVTRRRLGDQVGWWGDYYHQQGDPELAIKIYNAGYDIKLLPKHFMYHYPGKSENRTYYPDAELFYERWHDWKRDGGRNRHLQRGHQYRRFTRRAALSGSGSRRQFARRHRRDSRKQGRNSHYQAAKKRHSIGLL